MSDKCDAYTPLRWEDRRCDRPATHVVVDQGEELGSYCDYCWVTLLARLKRPSRWQRWMSDDGRRISTVIVMLYLASAAIIGAIWALASWWST